MEQLGKSGTLMEPLAISANGSVAKVTQHLHCCRAFSNSRWIGFFKWSHQELMMQPQRYWFAPHPQIYTVSQTLCDNNTHLSNMQFTARFSLFVVTCTSFFPLQLLCLPDLGYSSVPPIQLRIWRASYGGSGLGRGTRITACTADATIHTLPLPSASSVTCSTPPSSTETAPNPLKLPSATLPGLAWYLEATGALAGPLAICTSIPKVQDDAMAFVMLQGHIRQCIWGFTAVSIKRIRLFICNQIILRQNNQKTGCFLLLPSINLKCSGYFCVIIPS